MGVTIRGGHFNNVEGGVPIINKVLIDLGVPRNNERYH